MKKFNSPIEAIEYWATQTPDSIFLVQPIDGKIHKYTYKEGFEEIRRLANGLMSLSLPEKSNIALLSKNCAHWFIADMAIIMAGHVSIPIYPTLNADSISKILDHSESKLLIVGKMDKYDEFKPGLPDIKKIGIETYGIHEEYSWEKLISENEPLEVIPVLDKDDLITIMYTSGTTGTPKGVMHSAGNFAQTSNTAIDIIPLPERPRFFSYLPLSHVAERVAIEIHGIFRGGQISFPESLESFPSDLEAAKPHLFFAVPRIWSKFQEKILEKMPQSKLNILLNIPVINGLVRKKIQEKLGLSETHYAASGAAPIAASLQKWYKKLGIIIHQDYGMTEDSVLSHYNLPGANKFGTVGKAVPGVTGKLSSEGEICIKSDVLMKGYYKEPELTAEMFDEDGFLKTGDIGEYDHDGYLTITGRIKDQFKTDKGKYISPGPIELELLKNPDIEQACLVGMGIPQPIALVILSEEARKKDRETVSASLTNSINSLNPALEKHEKIEKAVVMMEDWTVDNGLLTPTLKVKRNQVEKIHLPMYKEWFKMEDKVIYE